MPVLCIMYYVCITKIALILKEKFQIFQNLQVQGQRHSHPSAASSLNVIHVNSDDEDMG